MLMDTKLKSLPASTEATGPEQNTTVYFPLEMAWEQTLSAATLVLYCGAETGIKHRLTCPPYSHSASQESIRHIQASTINPKPP